MKDFRRVAWNHAHLVKISNGPAIRVLVAFVGVAVAASVIFWPSGAGARGDVSEDDRAWAEDNGPIVVGVPQLPPVALRTGDGDALGGFAVELTKLAADRVDVEVEFRMLGNVDAVVAALEAGEVDAVAGLAGREDLMRIADGTEPISWSGGVFVVPADSDVVGVDDLGPKVSTIIGSPLEGVLRAQYPDFEIVPTDNVADGVAALIDGRIDVYLGPVGPIGWEMRQQGELLRTVGDDVTQVQSRIWAAPNSPALRILAEGRSRITDRELLTAHLTWTGFDLGPPADEGFPSWLLRLLAVLGVALVVLAVFVVTLRRQVARRTAELRAHRENLEQTVADRTAELQEANEDLEAFVRSASHDLKGPLAVSKGLADLLLAADSVQHDERSADIAARLRKQSTRLSAVVDGYLALASTKGGTGLRPSVVDLTALVYEAAVQVADQYPDQRVEVDVQGDLTAVVDRDLLRQALVNLISNAHRHAGDGSHLHVFLRERDGHRELVLADDGPGFGSVPLESLFEDFVRDANAEGHGVGLANVRRIAERHGGSVGAEPGDPSGARFWLRLPSLGGDVSMVDV